MKLFYKPGACSLAAHIILRETGKDFTLYCVDLVKHQLENGDDYLAINPKGQVPALLLDDDTVLTEGVVILQYLADNANDYQLLSPINSIMRYKTLEWINYIATELHKWFTLLFRSDTPEKYKSTVHGILEKKLYFINNLLKEDQWINGSHFTIADAYLFTVLRWARMMKLNFNIEELRYIASYIDRITMRPTVASALKAEKLSLNFLS